MDETLRQILSELYAKELRLAGATAQVESLTRQIEAFRANYDAVVAQLAEARAEVEALKASLANEGATAVSEDE